MSDYMRDELIAKLRLSFIVNNHTCTV